MSFFTKLGKLKMFRSEFFNIFKISISVAGAYAFLCQIEFMDFFSTNLITVYLPIQIEVYPYHLASPFNSQLIN
jgi:hypothetical protein